MEWHYTNNYGKQILPSLISKLDLMFLKTGGDMLSKVLWVCKQTVLVVLIKAAE